MAYGWITTTESGDLYRCQGCDVVLVGTPDRCPVCKLGRFEESERPFAPKEYA